MVAGGMSVRQTLARFLCGTLLVCGVGAAQVRKAAAEGGFSQAGHIAFQHDAPGFPGRLGSP